MNRTVKKGILLFLCSLGFIKTYPAIIEGFAPDYAGRVLVFYTYSDPVLKNKNEALRLVIDDKGNFRQEVKTDVTLFCLSDFDIYKMMMMVTPESSLKIKLPPLRKKTLVESKNPYFKPVALWIQVIGAKDDEINNLVSKLELRYNQLTNRYFNQLYYRNSTDYLDSVKVALESEFLIYNQPLLKRQVGLKLKILESEINPAGNLKIFKGIFLPDYDITNPAFIDLFDMVFANKLTDEANSIKAGDLKKAISSGNLVLIKNFFREKYNLDANVADYVILKILHDAYYSRQFSEKTIVTMLDDKLFVDNADKKIREIAAGVKQKLLFLSPGSIAPVICLEDLSEQPQCSDKLKENTYVLFADTEMKVCQEHLKYLSTIASKFKSPFGIYIVIKNSDIKTIKKFFSENEIPGIKVIEDLDNRFAGEYKVRSYPSAFLLDGNHKVLLAPAKNPLDGFEMEYAVLLREKQMEKFRNQR
jgi:hypothetical protein